MDRRKFANVVTRVDRRMRTRNAAHRWRAVVVSLPVALASGAGVESRRPLGTVVVGGLLFSQLITLYITPVIHTYLDPYDRRVEHSLAREEQSTDGHFVPAT